MTVYAGDGALRLMPYQMGDRNQQWERDFQQGYIRCRHDRNRVLDIYGQSTRSVILAKSVIYSNNYYMPGDMVSSWVTPREGMPQSSWLGPLIFIILADDRRPDHGWSRTRIVIDKSNVLWYLLPARRDLHLTTPLR